MGREGQELPAKYALELLTIYVWEKGSGKEDFKTEEGFRTVLEVICNYKHICIYWTEYYDIQHEFIGKYLKKQLSGERPIILDPADPTGNVARRGRWDLVAEEARKHFRTANVWNVNPTKPINAAMIEIFVQNLDGNSKTYEVMPNETVLELKKKIQVKEKDIPVEQQQLVFCSRILENHHILSFYGIRSGSTVNLTLRLRGGQKRLCSVK
nr:PREDICTED: 2'-5'-oligoadenylate synthase-like protein 2 isoform X1 [Latimeria chalumnae]|eukprot:XP_005990339.1 PREDICTED: 2'-5'-oligoadenylate synthase-like protein 2 isoform X1 [Latimeria chalumnae]